MNMKSSMSRNALGWLLVMPALVLSLMVVTLPSLTTYYFSLTKWNGLTFNPEFIGLKNFINLLGDKVFYKALQNNIIWTVEYIFIILTIGLLLSIMIKNLGRGQMLLRTIFFLPYMIAVTVNSSAWGFILNPSYGINFYLKKAGLGFLALKWLGDPTITIFSLSAVNTWANFGFIMVVFLSALQQIDPEMYEFCRIEGATRIKTFFYVTLPLIKPTIIFLVQMAIVWSFLAFNYVYIMTRGGPGISSEILTTYIYRTAFFNYDAGYANSIAVALSSVCFMIIILFNFFRKKVWRD